MKNSLPPFKLITHLITLDLTASELKVAIALALCRNSHSGRCCPSQTSLVSTIHISRATIVRALTKLRAKKVVQQLRCKRTSSNHYFFLNDLTELTTISRSNGNAYKELEKVAELLQNNSDDSLYCNFDDASP